MGTIVLFAIKRSATETEAETLRARIDALALGADWVVRIRYSDARVVEK